MKGENKSSMNNSIYNGIGLIEGWAINSQASYKPLLIDACNNNGTMIYYRLTQGRRSKELDNGEGFKDE